MRKIKVGQEIFIKKYRGITKNVKGVVEEIRDIIQNPLKGTTIINNTLVRSQKIATIKLETGETKGYYTKHLKYEVLKDSQKT